MEHAPPVEDGCWGFGAPPPPTAALAGDAVKEPARKKPRLASVFTDASSIFWQSFQLKLHAPPV